MSHFKRQYNQEVNKKFREAGDAIVQLAKSPVIFGEQNAKAFLKGLKAISDMSEKSFLEWQGKSIEEIREIAKGAKSESDKQIGAAINFLHKAMGFMSDAKLGGDISNVYAAAERARQKEYHADNASMISNQVMQVQSVVNLLGESVDLGYLAAFSSVDARNSRTVRVSDLLWQIRFMELSKGEEPELSGGADERSQDLTAKIYGGAVSVDDYDVRFSPVSANQMISGFRIKAEQILSHAAYKEIFINRTGEVSKALIDYYPETANDDAQTKRWRTVHNGRHTLNEATADLIDFANHVNPGNKRTQNRTEAPLMVPADNTILVYYNHRNAGLMNDIQSTQLVQDAFNTNLTYNYVFISTTKAPTSGAWKSDDTTLRDEHGCFGTVKEASTKNHEGCKIVIPGYRNLNITFQGLTIGQDRRNVSGDTLVGARQRALHKMDLRQSAWVKLS